MLARKLKTLRAMRDWSQTDLAKKSGVSLCAISFIENEHKVPRVSTLIKLANALEVNESELLKYLE